jgi:ABC-type branched-subunit amino acid transport system substrate-binding protein
MESNSGDKKYTVGGELPIDSPYYIRRNADRNLVKSLKEGKFCYVLNPRQTGKSSLMIQIKHDLEAERTKYYCSIIYIPTLIDEQETTEENLYTPEEQFYESLIDQLAQDFIEPIHKNIVPEFSEWLEQWRNDHINFSPVERLTEFLENQLLVKNRDKIVIFFDEIDSIFRLNFDKNKFWNFIQSCYDKCQNIPRYQRLTFAIFGVTTLDELIQDQDSKLLKIGQAIELDNFDNSITNQFQEGLKNKFNNNMSLVRTAINAILSWTNGQPFLTNQICQMLQDINELFPNSKSEIETFIEELVKSKIIDMDNWQVLENKKDETNNLKAIYNQFLTRGRRNPRLLKCYQEILKAKQNGIDTNDSAEQRELLVSGLVLKTEGGKLKVYNQIYELVFNQEWLEKAIQSIPPYAQSFDNWLKFNEDLSYLLCGQELLAAFIWRLDNELNEDEYRFLQRSVASDKERQQEEAKKFEKQKQSHNTQLLTREDRIQNKHEISELNKKIQLLKSSKNTIIVSICSILISGLLVVLADRLFDFKLYDKYFRKIITAIPQLKSKNKVAQKGFSNGEQFLLNDSESSVTKGIENFKDRSYEQAIEYFEQALEINPNAPEIQIYINNAKAHQRGSRFQIAVAVPENNLEEAKEILRGVADAQNEFNGKSSQENTRLLEIFIVNVNDKDRAQLAKKLVSEEGIQGMIIPELGCQNMKEYKQSSDKDDQSELPIISMTSTQISLCLKNLPEPLMTFSDDQLAEKLTEYADKKPRKEEIKEKKVVIFYDSQDNTNLKQNIEKKFKSEEWEIYESVDLSSLLINPDSEIDRSLKNEVSAAVLLPSPKTYDAALRIVKANAQNTSINGGLQLFSNHIMYDSKALIEGQSSVKGLTLILPWSDETPSKKSYVEQANKTWYGQTSWRTTASYAATKVLIEALSRSNAEGTTALENLDGLEPSGDPPLVIVSPDAPTPKGAKLGFMPPPKEKK